MVDRASNEIESLGAPGFGDAFEEQVLALKDAGDGHTQSIRAAAGECDEQLPGSVMLSKRGSSPANAAVSPSPCAGSRRLA